MANRPVTQGNLESRARRAMTGGGCPTGHAPNPNQGEPREGHHPPRHGDDRYHPQGDRSAEREADERGADTKGGEGTRQGARPKQERIRWPQEGRSSERGEEGGSENVAPEDWQRIKAKPTLAAAFCLPLHNVPLRDNRGATHPKKWRTGP